MRFTSILLALPLLGSVFAAPAPVAKTELVERCAECGNNDALSTIVGILTDLKVSLDHVVPSHPITVKAEAHVALGSVISNCNTAFTKISANVQLKAKLKTLTAAEKKIVAKVVADVMININAIIKALDASICVDAEVKAWLSACNSIAASLFLAVEACVSGCLKLAASICASVHINISPLFTCLTVTLKAYVGGLLGGLVGGLLHL